MDVHRLPEDDDVEHEAEGAQLVLLVSLVVLAWLAAPAVEDIPGQAVAALAPAEDAVDGPAVGGVVAVVSLAQPASWLGCEAEAIRSELQGMESTR